MPEQEPIQRTIHVSVPPEIIVAVKLAAEAERRSVSNFVAKALAEYLGN